MKCVATSKLPPHISMQVLIKFQFRHRNIITADTNKNQSGVDGGLSPHFTAFRCKTEIHLALFFFPSQKDSVG
jgi:hypothetical protein